MSDNELLLRAFAVEADDDEFDLLIPPTSGHEYLKRVQLEARQCPSVVVAEYDPALYQEKQTVRVSAGSGLQPAPAGYIASCEWQKHQAISFSRLRQKLARYKARMKKQSEAQGCTILPRRDNVSQWCKLCFGRYCAKSEEDGCTGSSTDTPALTVTSVENHATNVTPDEVFANGSMLPDSSSGSGLPPLLSVVTRMDQPTVIKVLEYHVNWFEATGFSTHQGQWFYALLAALEKPLAPEACSLLRTLARNCANLRASLASASHSQLVPLNLLICIVARYFDQTDLADDA